MTHELIEMVELRMVCLNKLSIKLERSLMEKEKSNIKQNLVVLS